MTFQLDHAVSKNHPSFKPIQIGDAPITNDTECVFSGWGFIDIHSKTAPEHLQIGKLKVISTAVCKEKDDRLPEKAVCATGASPCTVGYDHFMFGSVVRSNK